MTDTTNPVVRSAWFYLVLLWLAGVGLRLTILAVPPVLPLIHRDLALSEKEIGMLSALPALLLGLAAIPGSLTIARFGAHRSCLMGLALVAFAGAARGIGPSTPMLFGMTLLMGAGAAIMQPTLPSLVGEWFPHRAGFATAVYANGLLISEAVPPTVTLPLVLPWVGGSWELSFVAWSIPVALTALLFAATPRHRPPVRSSQSPRWWPDWRDPLSWQLGLMLGGTGGTYFWANTFLPDYLHAIGQPGLVSAVLSAVNIGQLPASAVILMFARRLTENRTVFVASPVLGLLGLVGLLSSSPVAIVAAAGWLGFCCGTQLILSLALPPLLAPAHDVHRLSAGMFAIGYFVSFVMQPIGGAIWDATGMPVTAFVAGGLSIALVLGAALTLPRVGPVRTARAV
jgi:MFS transporter, CP family, cyanate transporter